MNLNLGTIFFAPNGNETHVLCKQHQKKQPLHHRGDGIVFYTMAMCRSIENLI